MEHRLIQGGEQYLPFARSCVAKLKKLGTPYADQSYEIDGVSIKVRIEPGHEYIRIEGGSDALKMDSGIVDVGMTASTIPARYLAGTLIKPASVLFYDSMFTTESTSPWWLNPGTTSDGQLSGELTTGTRISGKIRKDGVAKSFSPRNSMQGTPAVLLPDAADEALVLKKKAADLCPPSMFTGRARLYAQALMGQYLYDSKLVDGAERSNSPPELVLSAPPQLKLSLYKDKDSARAKAFYDANEAAKAVATAQGYGLVFPDPYNVTLNINSGVYLDEATGKHWLINPTLGRVVIYPLVPSAGGMKARKHLKSNSKLNLEDREHLEAYILATCRPHVELQTVLTVGDVNPYSCGYGWHWNWSGTQADMVQSLFDHGLDNGTSIAKHHRLTVAATTGADGETLTWAAATSVIETSRFAVLTSLCCFTHPNWTNRYTGVEPDHDPIYMSEKGPFKYTGVVPECNAPIYAFYRKDTLTVARIVVVVNDAQQKRVEFTKGYCQWSSGSSISSSLLVRASINPADSSLSYSRSYYSAGLEPAHLYDDTDTGRVVHYKITCDVHQVDNITGFITTRVGSEFGAKTMGAWPTPTPFNTSMSHNIYELGGWHSVGYYTGGPAYNPFAATAGDYLLTSFGNMPAYFDGPYYNQCSYPHREWDSSIYPVGVCGAIIPFYDAETFYVLEDTLTREDKHPTDEDTYVSYLFERDYYIYSDEGVLLGHGEKILWNVPQGGTTGVAPPPETIDTDHVVSLSMVSTAGTDSGSVIPSEAYEMFEDADAYLISGTFRTISSASSFGPVLHGLFDKQWPAETIGRPALVGWV